MKYIYKIIAVLLIAFTSISVHAQMDKVIDNLAGKYEITADAGGSLSNPYTITIPKPAGATTVAKAYVYCAGIIDFTPYTIGPDDISIDGAVVTLGNLRTATYTPSGTIIRNHHGRYGEVSSTSAIISKLNAAAGGANIKFSVAEVNSSNIDGVGMIVLWNVPSNSYGVFSIHLGMQTIPASSEAPYMDIINTDPVQKGLPGFNPVIGIGINFSTGTGGQNSKLWVGGPDPQNTPANLVSSNIGGSDDGSNVNGTLITLGGFGDSPASNDADELFAVGNFLTEGQEKIYYGIRDYDNAPDDILNAIYFSGAGVGAKDIPAENILLNCGETTTDLSDALTGTVPSGAEVRWYTTEDHSTPQLTPAEVAAAPVGTYYPFYYYTANGLYSAAAPVNVELGYSTGSSSVDLTALYNGPALLPNVELVWYTTPDHQPGTQVADPAHVTTSGIYYAFFHDTVNDCYNTDNSTTAVTVNILPTCPDVIGCSTDMYLSQGADTTLHNIDTSANPFVYDPPIGSPAGFHYNAMGINPLDQNLYAIKAPTNILLRINADGSTTELGAITGLPNGGSPGIQSYNSGEIDDQGNYYVVPFNGATLVTTMYKIDITTKTAVAVPLSTGVRVSDLAYNTVTGLLYGVNANGQLISIDPVTGTVTNIGTSPGAQTFGAMFGSSTGDVYGINNLGGFYQFDITTGARVKISDAPANNNNDGAHCVTQPITFDADLSVTKTDGTSSYTAGVITTYTIEASNTGPFGVLNAHVEDAVPAGIPNANVSYTATVSGGALTQVTGTQTGAIDDYVSLPVGGKVIYTVTVNIPSTFTGNLVNTVTITPPVSTNDPDTANNTATDTDTDTTEPVCYKPGATTGGAILPTKSGITALGRAGADHPDNWPMVRKGGWLALEAKTKGFVVNRVAFEDADSDPLTPQVPVGIAPANFVEGMMVYDTTNNCLKMYTSADGGTTFAWYCISTQTCPD